MVPDFFLIFQEGENCKSELTGRGAKSTKSENSITDLGVLFSDLALQIYSNFTILRLRKLPLKTILQL